MITREDHKKNQKLASETSIKVSERIAKQREVRLDEKTTVYSSDLTTPIHELREKLIKKFKLNEPLHARRFGDT
jgi:hypothetical protein